MKKIKFVLWTIFFMVISTAMLFAAEAAEAGAEIAAGRPGEGLSKLLAHIGVALAVGIPGLGTGWAQSRIGAAGAGTIAERPETAIWIIVMLAIPETTVILGFVIAFMLMGKI